MTGLQDIGNRIARAALAQARDCANDARLREAMPSEFEIGMVAGQVAAAEFAGQADPLLLQAVSNESRFLLYRYWVRKSS